MQQLKILHAIMKVKDSTCSNQDPAGPSKKKTIFKKSISEKGSLFLGTLPCPRMPRAVADILLADKN